MTLPAGFPYPLKQEVEIPLEQIIPNPDQPRKFENKEAIQLLAASMRAKGQEVAARVRPLTEEERITYPHAWVMLIGGHGRREAALANQFKTLKCTIEDITPAETLSTAARDNSIRDMHWWEWYLVFEAVDKAGQKSRKEIADEFGQYETKVHNGLKVTRTLNQPARTLVQENIQKGLILNTRTPSAKNKAFSITESHLLVLADLGDPGQVHQALQMVLDDYLTADQAQKLVEHMQSGTPAEGYTPAPKAAKAKTPKAQDAPVESSIESQPAAPSPSHTAPASPVTKATGNVSWFWELIAGISFISAIKAKIKKGETLSKGEALLVLGWRFLKNAGWLLKHAIKAVHQTVKFTWRVVIDALKTVGLYQFVKAVVVLALLAGMIWLGWDIHEHGVYHPLKLVASWVWKKSPSVSEANASMPAAQPTPLVATQAPAAKTEIKHHPQSPALISSPSVAAFSGDPAALQPVIAAIPNNSVIKPIALAPSDMGGAMAGRRLQDLMEPEKFKVMIGHDAQRVAQVTATSTNLTLTFPAGLIGGASKLDFYWEDVKTIHVSQIDAASPQTRLYQCVVDTADAKVPFVAQCSTPENLNHLVSALEFWIRAARAGQGAPIASLPYLYQGLTLTNDVKAALLWADSPADKAGVKLGARVWSVGKNSPQQQTKSEIETALRNLSPGPHDFYFVTQAEWANAQDHRDYKHDYGYKPARVKTVITAL